MSVAHVVKKGECLSSIAKQYRFSDWRRIYDHPDNAAFKAKRPNPDLIYPGDVVMIPEKAPSTATLSTDEVHVIKVKAQQPSLRILLEVDEPHAYELELPAGVVAGQTDGQSPIEHPIPADLKKARLTIWPASGDRTNAISWALAPGDLDPVEELSGIQGRLANLGYYWGAVDGQPSSQLDEAVARFRKDEKLEASADIDDALRERLKKRHDDL
jgi:N-acetylmuramoyl-L-alanine amidase